MPETLDAASSACGDDDGVAFGSQFDLKAAGPREHAGVKRLNSVGIDRPILRASVQQRRHRMRDTGIQSSSRDLEALAVAGARRLDGQPAAAWNRLGRDDQHIEQQLGVILWKQFAWQV